MAATRKKGSKARRTFQNGFKPFSFFFSYRFHTLFFIFDIFTPATNFQLPATESVRTHRNAYSTAHPELQTL